MMNNLNGYVKDYRSCLMNPLFNEKPFDRWHAFQYCILTANYKSSDVICGNITLRVERGQFLTSVKSLAETFGWTEKQVRVWLKLLERMNMLSAKGHTKGTTITVVNYTIYQGEGQAEGQELGEHWASTGQQLKKDKKDKNNINNNNIPPTIEEVRVYCLERENRVNPEQFIDYYESKGWLIGKSKMKDWKAAVRTWERRNHEQSSKGNTDKFTNKKFGDYL